MLALKRFPQNPIISPDDMPFECYAVYNCGAIMFKGKVLLLLRTEDYTRKTTFYTAVSDDGIHFTVSKEPINYPVSEFEKDYGTAHRFDMRATLLEGKYYICHAVGISGMGCLIGMATTEDFVNFKSTEYFSQPQNRNAVLFPEKIDGMYVRLDRPQVNDNGFVWVSRSPDLKYWGDHKPIQLPATPWSWRKTGPAAIPIKTDRGWLIIYHAVTPTCSTENYFLATMVLDLNEPWRVLAAPDKFILHAKEPYECMGQVPNVVFAGGAVEMPDGTLNIYYGGADTNTCLAQTTVKNMLDFCFNETQLKK